MLVTIVAYKPGNEVGDSTNAHGFPMDDMPEVIIPSIQINMCAGNTPPAEDDGNVYLKVPLNRL